MTNSQSGLAAGAARTDITPPLEVGLLMSSVERKWAPFEGIRTALMARALVIRGSDAGDNRSNSEPVALVALDLLALTGDAVGGWSRFKRRIAAAGGDVVHPDRIVLTCSHTHCGPESVALSDLYTTPAFVKWIDRLVEQIGRAIREAAGALRPCQMEYGSTPMPGWGLHRRIKTTRGILLSHPPPPQEIVISREGPVDDSVNLVSFRDGRGQLIASVMNATCHPVHEMCMPFASADFPGVLSDEVERMNPGSVALFMNGAAGNINPATVSAGREASVRHGLALAEVVEGVRSRSTFEPSAGVKLIRKPVALPSRLPDGVLAGKLIHTEVIALALGDVVFAFLPGEPFVETGLALRAASPFELTVVVGYVEDHVGYVPTDQAFIEGGYETEFGRWSVLGLGSEPALRQAAQSALQSLHAGHSATESTTDGLLEGAVATEVE